MPWAEKLPTGRYRAGWRDAAGARRYSARGDDGKPFIQRAAAERYAGKREEGARTGTDAGQVEARTGTWGAWCEVWRRERTVVDSTRREDDYRIDKYLLPRWGNRRLASITHAEVQAWCDGLAAEHAAGTVRRVHANFSASLKAAMIAKKIPANPATSVTLPKPIPRPPVYLTRGEVDAVLAQMSGAPRALVALLVGTGIRFGEAAGLHWSNVDLDRQRVYVQDTYNTATNRITPHPKGRKPRVVPLPDWTAVELAPLASDAASCGLTHIKGGRCTSGLVLLTAAGTPVRDDNVRARAWKPACADAGIRYVRLHDLRHTTASWWRHGGLSLATVQELLGHASIETTQIYSHIGSQEYDDALAILEGRPASNAGPVPSIAELVAELALLREALEEKGQRDEAAAATR